MRTLRAATVLSLLAVLLVPAADSPAGAVEPIRAEGVVYAGLYPAVWDSADDLNALKAWSGKRVTFAGSFHHPDENNPWFSNTGWILEQAWLAHATPFANLEIPDDPGATAAAIAGGVYDASITDWANHVKAWLDTGGGRSLLIAPFPEMNGDWVPYGVDPVNFRAAYRRVVGIFRGMGMDETKVRWVFAPNGWSSHGYGYTIADYYPGDDVVDAIGISAYNFGAAFENGWEDIDRVFAPWIEEIRSTVTVDKPYFITQTASSSNGGDKNQWLVNLFEYAAADPNIVGFVYFNRDKVEKGVFVDWAVWRNPSGVAGWKTGMQRATTGYQWPLTSWFQPGPLPFAGPATATPPCPDGADCDRLALVDGSSAFRLYDRVAAGASTTSFYYGQPADVALMGDWNCDGVDTPAMYRPSNGFVYLRNSNSFGVAELDFFFGLAGDIPIVGDWNGDGCDTLGIYRPSEAKVYVRNTLGTGVADREYYYGVPGDRPFSGDFDGDGKSTVGLYRQSTGFVYFRNTLTTGVADFDFFYGEPSDRILAGDWDGNGTDTVAVYRPSTGKVYFRNSNSQGMADYTLTVGGSYTSALAAG